MRLISHNTARFGQDDEIIEKTKINSYEIEDVVEKRLGADRPSGVEIDMNDSKLNDQDDDFARFQSHTSITNGEDSYSFAKHIEGQLVDLDENSIAKLENAGVSGILSTTTK